MVRATPHNGAAELAMALYEAALEAIRADRLVRQAVRRDGGRLFLQDRPYDLADYRRVFVAGAGKACVSMAEGLLEALEGRVEGGLLVTKAEDDGPAPLRTLHAGHPVLDERSLEAGEEMLRFAEECRKGDLVLFLLSGGASALLEAPEEGLELEHLQETTRVLLASGLDIRHVNAIRAQLSRVKRGGLARAFAPAEVVVLVLSDVIGGDLASVGSGPFLTNDPGVDLPFDLPARLPEPVRHALFTPITPAPAASPEHIVVGSLTVAVHAALDAAAARDLHAFGFSEPLLGEARDEGRRVAGYFREQTRKIAEPLCLVFGGEPTVTLSGDGRGGRCQELAAAATPLLARMNTAAVLAAGTDGDDGPTDAAGALIDPGSLARARESGQDLRRALARNDTHAFLKACHGLVYTGATGTNLNDLVLAVHLPDSG